MASLGGILNIASTALQSAQTSISVVSNNVSNVNTPGYVREVANQESLVVGGAGGGVAVTSITRAADTYLQQASLSATGNAGNYGAISSYLDQAQKLFGDPSSSSTLFDQLDQVFSAFSAQAAAPSGVTQSQSVAALQTFFNQATRISQSLQTLQSQTKTQISSDVATVNDLLQKISDLNTVISQGTVSGSNVTGYQDLQSQYTDQLSKLIDIKVSQDGSATGAITIRGSDGTALTTLGRSPAVFTYDQSNGSGQLLFTPPGGQQQPYGTRLTSGELEGLLHAQNTDLPNLSQQLAEFTAGTASALNQASNAYSSTPAPASLTGKDIGIDVPSAIANFTGKTTIAIVNTQGVIQKSVAIDFTAKTLSVNGGAASSFGTASTFIASLNAALAPAGGASVSGSVLSLTAAGGNGVAVADDPTTPSQLGGKGFSQYFGLNDVITSKGASDYATGLTAGSASGFTSGALKFRVATADGTDVADVIVSPTSGQTLGQLVTQLNASSGGLGAYGSFALDSTGAIAFTARSGSNLNLGVVSDTTTWNGTGPSFTQLFGIDPSTRIYRTGNLAVNAAIVQQPGLLPNAKLNLTAAAGAIALSPGDTRGADALGQAGTAIRNFQAAGLASASTVTLSNYSAALSARIGAAASNASTSATNATAAATEAQSRRSGVEGVNLDQELISLTTYQQAYNASARLLTAAKDMYDTLLAIVR